MLAGKVFQPAYWGNMRTLILGAAAILGASAAPAGSQESPATQPAGSPMSVSLSSGIDYSTGKYGEPQSTDILVGLTSVAVIADDFQFFASLPYLTITGPAYLVVGAGGVPVVVNPKLGASSVNRSGWGDPSLSATYTFPSDHLDDFNIAITGRTKIAAADSAKGLSTGATDFAFSVDVSRQFDVWSPFVTFGYRIPGNPAFYAFNDAPSFSVGTSVLLDDRLVVIASYDFDGSISSSIADAQQIFGSVSWLFNDDWTFTAYAEAGLSSGAPRVGTGLMISRKLF
jgi:hypothetical protein